MIADIYELLRHFDLDENNCAHKIDSIGLSRLRPIYESLWTVIYETQYGYSESIKEGSIAGNTFRFLAGASIRGENCAGCRPKKLEFLARYAAMYSDFVILPLPLTNPENDYSSENVRQKLISAVNALFQLRSSIEEGIIRPAVMTTAECQHTYHRTQELIDTASDYADELAEQYFDQFTMYYKPNQGSNLSPALLIKGPADFLEHGSIIIEYPDVPSWVARSWRPDANGLIQVPIRKAKKTGWVNEIFSRIAIDTTFHLAYGTHWHAKFLTDLRGETILMGDSENNEESQSLNLLQAMTHSLPFIDDLPIDQLLRLRRETRESFEQYRLAIFTLIQQHSKAGGVSKRIANEICLTDLAPKISALETKISAERKRLRSKIITSAGVAGIVIALGLSEVFTKSQVLGLLGGAATFRAADVLSDAINPAPEVSTQELYFLLKLKQIRRKSSLHK